MSTHPYIPLYVDDYDAHTAHLTPAQDGIYGRMLRVAWRTPGCSLPNDEAWIARKVRLSKADWERIGKPVLEEFFKLQRGRFIQKRLKAEYDGISRKKTARATAGKKGGDAKAQKTKGKTSSNATVLPGDTRAFPEPEPKIEEANAPSIEDRQPDLLADVVVKVSGFDEFWRRYPLKVGKGAARPAYQRAVKRIGGHDPGAVLLAGLDRVLPNWTDPKYTPHPTTWLNRDGWEDEPAPPTVVNLHDAPRPSTRREADYRERLSDIGAAMDAAVLRPASGG